MCKEELNDPLSRICEEKKSVLSGQEQLLLLKRTISDQRTYILRLLLEDMESGREDLGRRISALQSQGLVFDRKRYSVLIIKFDIRFELPGNARTMIGHVRHLFEDSGEMSVSYSCVEEDCRLIVIIGHEEETVSGLMEKIIIANEYVKTCQHCGVSFGLCCSAGAAVQFPALYYEAYSASEMRRMRYNNVIRYDRVLPRIDSFFPYREKIRDAVESSVSQGDYDHLQKFLDDTYGLFLQKHAEYCYPFFLIKVFEVFRGMISKTCRSEFETSIDRLIRAVDNEGKIYKIRHVLEPSFREVFEKYLIRKLKDENYHITQAQKYIEKHYMEEISLQGTADNVHLNPVYFSNLFKNVTGMKYLDYVQKTRIDHARKKLISSIASIEQIANEVGYRDKRHFSRIFKRIVGMNPGTFRKLYVRNTEESDYERQEDILNMHTDNRI